MVLACGSAEIVADGVFVFRNGRNRLLAGYCVLSCFENAHGQRLLNKIWHFKFIRCIM